MRVTREQVKAEIICTNSDSCVGCPYYAMDNCENFRCNSTFIAMELLEVLDQRDKLLSALLGIKQEAITTSRLIEECGYSVAITDAVFQNGKVIDIARNAEASINEVAKGE